MARKARKIAISKWAHDGYFDRIIRAGGEPVEITETSLVSRFDRCKGLVIPGGVDVCPTLFGQHPHPRTQRPNFNRDCLEMALIHRALDQDMPVLGICRGHQLLNVALNGTLKQHIEHHNGYTHFVLIKNSKHMEFIKGLFRVNSLHHQSVDQLGNGLRVTATAHDGTVEAIESTKHSWVTGVQWHPEMRVDKDFDDNMSTLLHNFINAKN